MRQRRSWACRYGLCRRIIWPGAILGGQPILKHVLPISWGQYESSMHWKDWRLILIMPMAAHLAQIDGCRSVRAGPCLTRSSAAVFSRQGKECCLELIGSRGCWGGC